MAGEDEKFSVKAAVLYTKPRFVPGDEGVDGAEGLDSGSEEEDGTGGLDALGSGVEDSTGGWETGRGAVDDSGSLGAGYARLTLGVTTGLPDDSALLNVSAGTGLTETVIRGAAGLEVADGSGSAATALLLPFGVADVWWNLPCLCPCSEIDAGGWAAGSLLMDTADVVSESVWLGPASSESAETGAIGEELAGTAPTVTVTVFSSVTVIVANPHASGLSNAPFGLSTPLVLTGDGLLGASDESTIGAVPTPVETAPSVTTIVEPGWGTMVTTAIEVRAVPVGPMIVELSWPYGAADALVPCGPPVGKPAGPRG
jgi:hypothetical protein